MHNRVQDAIAGRKNTGVLTGDVFINGAPKDDKMFARLAAYVEQSDIHSPYLTVMETLQFSATMRLPASVTAQQRASLIEEILSVLDLQDVKHRVVGTVQAGGLSPSQLKRLSIATEMCAWPSLIFLDEPTSGACCNPSACAWQRHAPAACQLAHPLPCCW